MHAIFAVLVFEAFLADYCQRNNHYIAHSCANNDAFAYKLVDKVSFYATSASFIPLYYQPHIIEIAQYLASIEVSVVDGNIDFRFLSAASATLQLRQHVVGLKRVKMFGLNLFILFHRVTALSQI